MRGPSVRLCVISANSMNVSTAPPNGSAYRAETFSLKSLVVLVTICAAMFALVVRLVPIHMWFFMIPWSVFLPLQFACAVVAYRKLPRNVPNSAYQHAQRHRVAFTLSVISGLVPAAGWLFLVNVFALWGTRATGLWPFALNIIGALLITCHVLAHFTLLLSLCFWLAASPRDVRIALHQGLVLGNLTVPTVIYFLMAAI